MLCLFAELSSGWSPFILFQMNTVYEMKWNWRSTFFLTIHSQYLQSFLFQYLHSFHLRYSPSTHYQPNNTDHLVDNNGTLEHFFHSSLISLISKQHQFDERSTSSASYSRTETIASGFLRFRRNPMCGRLGRWSCCVSGEVWCHESNHERVDFVTNLDE